ncbi:winged helix DNA-binding domain-containing protein [Flavobacterium humi]|uniref:Winged helix DNA-binding domain-containing protein n=1 Tax=Flavobacterium humi TaxID=2562683 RepID=A0A4Z0LCS0_9FLAO|nr:winged helix DNA-binding domain-containing protein [Flavobacterium humi]TGD59671.1 winged helix DNA-binding domain-containing protein [Flavobacterium humi]
MEPIDISNIRLNNQQIVNSKFEKAKDLVGWMGVMQAQDYAMSKWALGTRLSGSTDLSVEEAIDKGEIIRTHLLRPTWHLASCDDIYWLLELSSPQIKSNMRPRLKELELSEAVLSKSNAIIEKALAGHHHLTREEIASLLNDAGIATNDNRLSHILVYAEMEGIVCSGATKGKKQTYALLPERVQQTKKFTKEESLAKLAQTYFSSHGPATLQDFIWWSGLPIKDARAALEMVKSGLMSETIDSDTFYFLQHVPMPKGNTPSLYLLPAFDEFLISYKNRTASLLLENHKKTISNNGIFYPIIVLNGKVAGLWKRTIKKESVIIETDLFQSENRGIDELFHEKLEAFGSFLNKKAEYKPQIV